MLHKYKVRKVNTLSHLATQQISHIRTEYSFPDLVYRLEVPELTCCGFMFDSSVLPASVSVLLPQKDFPFLWPPECPCSVRDLKHDMLMVTILSRSSLSLTVRRYTFTIYTILVLPSLNKVFTCLL